MLSEYLSTAAKAKKFERFNIGNNIKQFQMRLFS